MTSTISQIKYFSLDEARLEIRKRWNDTQLRNDVEAVLGDRILPGYKDSPKATLWKATISPDNTFDFFIACAAYINIEPVFLEHHFDKFTSLNEEKKNLGRLFLRENGNNKIFDICNIRENENNSIDEVILRNGQKLIDFYNTLFALSGHSCIRMDISGWTKVQGVADNYYYDYLLHFICHGVAFEIFLSDDEDKNEVNFTKEVIIPKIEKIKKTFGLEPIIVKPYPDHQTKKEDFYWWSYNPFINDHLLNLCKVNNFNLKK